MTAASLASYLGLWRYNVTTEDSIQVGIAEALRREGFVFEREYRLSAHDRLDFFVGGRVAIEVKRHGSVNELLRQLSRYAEHDTVHELLVVTARSQLSSLPRELHGKPLECLTLLRSFF